MIGDWSVGGIAGGGSCKYIIYIYIYIYIIYIYIYIYIYVSYKIYKII